ncbi:MAG: imidazoleglycerol-phosphate dehydratase HisB [Acidimicrobiia bacterium]|nr:imidazoleglycerol-phosphate dehydratase HisB [Acidimicrobiia bacterium]
MARTAHIKRDTAETAIVLDLTLDGSGRAEIDTGIGFLDHLLTALTKHAAIDLALQCRGDLEVDDHHTVEDCGIVLGSAIDQAVGDRVGIVRFGSAYAPLDEALARAVVDVSGRGSAHVDLSLQRESIGPLATENIPHFLDSLARNAGITVHVDVLKGANDHHRAEAAFKALALALRQALALTGDDAVPSTKGVIAGGGS